MKKSRLFLLLFVFFLMQNGFSQNRLCVCFEKGNRYIEIKPIENSTQTHFSIVKPGYETIEKRQRAIEKYRQGPPVHPPVFYITYFATKEAVELNSLKQIDCTGFVSLEEFRESKFKRPPNTRSDLFIFIQKLSNDKFLKWEVVKNAME